MIEANKKLIKANLTQGVVGIQSNLVGLYQTNLSAMATQAALIAGFAFTAVGNTSVFTSTDDGPATIPYFVYALFTLCLVAALFVLSQATIVVMFGPSMALKGADQASVKRASEYMREEQWRVFTIGAVSISSLFAGSCILSWTLYPTNIAAITTCIYVVGYFILFKEGQRAYHVFVPVNDVTLNDPNSNVVKTPSGVEMDKATFEANVDAANEKKRFKYKGYIWKRRPADQGGLFMKCYGVLKMGKLDFFKSEQDYLSHADPINAEPVRLKMMDLELDPQKFTQDVTSISSVVKASMMGDHSRDFALTDLMASTYDLPYAAKHYRFALVPKISSELQAIDSVEMLGQDELMYNEWTNAFRTVLTGFDEDPTSTVEGTLRAGANQVEVLVKAANYGAV